MGEFLLLGADFAHRGRTLNEWLRLAASAFAQMPGPVRADAGVGWLSPALVRPAVQTLGRRCLTGDPASSGGHGRVAPRGAPPGAARAHGRGAPATSGPTAV